MKRPDYFIADELINELTSAFTYTLNDLAKSDADRFRILGQADVIEWLRHKQRKNSGDSE